MFQSAGPGSLERGRPRPLNPPLTQTQPVLVLSTDLR